MLFPFITGKNFAFRIIVEIVFVAWFMLALRDEKYRPRFSWLLVSLTAFTFFVGLADFFAENPAKAFWSNYERMEGFLSIFHLFLYFVVLSSVFNIEKYWNRFWYTWLGASVIMCIYSTFQLAGKIVINQGGARVDGTLGNAIYLAIFLLFNIFLTIFLFFRSHNKKKVTLPLVFILFFQFLILYFTATRGAVLGLLGGVFVSVLLIAIFEKKHLVLRKVALFVIVFILFIIFGFIGVRKSDFVLESPVLSRFASLSITEIKNQGRFFIWPMAVEGFKDRPILGWGQEGFSYVFNEKYNPKMYAQEQWFDRAHSAPLDWLVASGVFGFIFYLSILFFAFFYIWKSKNQNFSLAERSILTGLLAGYVFQSIFVFDNLVSYILLFSVLSMIHSVNGGDYIRLPKFLLRKESYNFISALLIIIFLLSFYFWNWKPIQASQTLIDGLRSLQRGNLESSLDNFEGAISYNAFGNPEIREQLASVAPHFSGSDVPMNIRDRYLNLTRSEYEKQIKETPKDARYYLFYAIFLRSYGDTEKALTYLDNALRLSPQKQTILFEIGATYLQRGEFEKALPVFKSAYELESSYNDAKIFYGIAALYANEIELANRILSSIPRQRLIFDDRLARAYAEMGRYGDLISILEARISEGADTIDNSLSLSMAYLRLGDKTKSIQILRRFMDIDPSRKEELEYYIDEIESGRLLQ